MNINIKKSSTRLAWNQFHSYSEKTEHTNLNSLIHY